MAAGGIKSGTKEVSVFASFMSITPDCGRMDCNVGTRIFSAQFGYLFTPVFQLNASFSTTAAVAEMDDSETTASTVGFGIRPTFNIAREGQPVVPYAGIELGLQKMKSVSEGDFDYETSSTGVSLGGFGGIKFFVSEATTLNLEVNLKTASMSDDEVGGEDDITTTFKELLVGMSFYF
jgi:hypothetical protein